MEAFGRMIAVLTAACCMIVLILVFKTASVYWQKNETVHSIASEYAEQILKSGIVSRTEQERVERELKRLGEYHIELTVYERKRFEGEAGRIYLYEEWDGAGERKVLSPGSYLRILVSEAKRGRLETFLYGDGGTVVTGGRMP